MYSPVDRIVGGADSRYLAPEEAQAVLDYAQSVPLRLKVAKAVEKNEDAFVRHCLALVRAGFPDLGARHEQAWPKVYRDMQLILRCVVQCMVLDDSKGGVDKLYVWIRTIFQSFGMDPQMMRSSYQILKDEFGKKFPEEAHRLMAPHFDVAIRTISDYVPTPNARSA